MDRRGYSNKGSRMHSTSSRADRASTWRPGRVRNNENRNENSSNMMNKDQATESLWNIPSSNKFNPYPPQPSSSRSFTANNNNGVQVGYQLFPPTASGPNIPPPGSSCNDNRYPQQQLPINTTNFFTRQERYAYENSLLSKFEVFNANNSRNDGYSSDNIFSFGQVSSSSGATSANYSSAFQQPAQQQQTWMPLQNVRVNTHTDITTCSTKERLVDVGIQKQPPVASTWSKVVAKGLPIARKNDNISIKVEEQQSSMMSVLEENEAMQPSLMPVKTDSSSLNEVSNFSLLSANTTATHHNIIDNQQQGGYFTNNNSTSTNNATRFISDSVGLVLTNNIFTTRPTQRPYTVIKIRNIPWSISTDDIKRIIKRCNNIVLPNTLVLPQSIHIIMDIKTGKTCGIAFAEVETERSPEGLRTDLDRLSSLPLQGRRLRFTESSYDDLRNNFFAKWKGEFRDGLAVLPDTDARPINIERRGDSEFYIGQKELQSLLDICRNYKLYYNRKCPERPFEYLMSTTMNIPWIQSRVVSTIQRDILYECYKLATDALRQHLSKQLHSFDTSLLPRLVRVALLCDGFTVKQKIGILNNSHLPCPEDLQRYVQEASPADHLVDELMSMMDMD